MLLLDMSFAVSYCINLGIYCVISLLVVSLSFLWLAKIDDDPNFLYIFGLVSWIVSVGSYLFIKDPEFNNETTARVFGNITGIISYVFFILQPLIYTIGEIPEIIRQRKASRKIAKETVKELAKKVKRNNLFDL